MLLISSLLFSTWGTTCLAAPAGYSAEQLSQIWQQEFPVPNADMAPSTFSTAKPAPRAGVLARSGHPHPAVARIIVPEAGATSFGSGTLIDVRDKFGMVITNWHVVRDATDTIEVVFPGGFTSKARAVKVDSDWDLAALVIWRPPVEPVSIASDAPRPGEELTICGYGQGNYRSVTGRCTQYCAPGFNFPRHMVELDVEARQGDSGGPIFNRQGELAGVLFGSGQGTTLGSFGGRVGSFLATLAPDIGKAAESLAENQAPVPPAIANVCTNGNCPSPSDPFLQQQVELRPHVEWDAPGEIASADQQTPNEAAEAGWPTQPSAPVASVAQTQQNTAQQNTADAWQPVRRRENLFEQVKTVLAAVGLVAIAVQMLRVAR